MSNCLYCNKPLKKIGLNRKNGLLFNNNKGYDWYNRKYHKCCYKIIKNNDHYNLFIEKSKYNINNIDINLTEKEIKDIFNF